MKINNKGEKHHIKKTSAAALVLFLPLTFVMSITLWFLYDQEVSFAKYRLREHAVNAVALQKAEVGSNFKLITDDLLFFSQYSKMLDMLEDPHTHQRRVTEDLLFFSRMSRIYDQIRVLGRSGEEVIRINLQGDIPVIVPEKELQHKGTRYYFQDTVRLSKGEIYVSPFDLNIEQGEIELPLKPVIRFGTPLFDRAGRKHGIVIFNYTGADLIRNLKKGSNASFGHTMLLNDKGYWLVGQDNSMEWGFMYPDKKDMTLPNLFPEVWKSISGSDRGQFSSMEGLYTFETVHPLLEGWKSSTGSGEAFIPSITEKKAREYFWKIVSFIPNDVFSIEAQAFRKKYGFIASLLLLLLGGASWIVASAWQARKEAKICLQQSHDDLERAVVERTINLDKTLRSLQESEERFRATFEQAAVGMAHVALEGHWLRVNQKLCEIVGYSREELLTKTFQDITHPDDLETDLAYVRQVLADEIKTYSMEKRYFCEDGRVAWINLTVSLVRTEQGEPKYFISVIEDISRRKEIEHELAEYRQHLEKLVTERTESLRAKKSDLERSQTALQYLLEDVNEAKNELEIANERLKELDRLKSMFIASMSHELRTPLNSVIGFSSILLNEWIGPVNEEQKENLKIILRAGRHLLNLVNDVIDVSKIEAGRIESRREEFDLYGLIMDAAEMVKTEASERGLEFTAEAEHIVLHTDRRRLMQCIMNLLSNAMKFTVKGRVRVTAQKDARYRMQDAGKDEKTGLHPESFNLQLNADFVEITVEDTGIGIRDEDIPKLFNSFVRLESPLKATAPGTGLGLYITKKIIAELLKGYILVTSSYGKGSRFSLLIPLEGTKKDEKSPGNRR